MHTVRRRLTELVAALGVGGLVLIPLMGLLAAIVHREPDPFTGRTASLAEIVQSSLLCAPRDGHEMATRRRDGHER